VRRLLSHRDLEGELKLAVKMTLAGTLAWWLASELGAHRPVFAVLVPLVAMTGDPFSALSVSIDRILGVFAGVGLGIGLVHLHWHSTVLVALALGLGMLIGIALRVGDRVNLQPAISALFLLGVAGGAANVGVTRIWETAVGAGVTLVVSVLVWPPHPVRGLTVRLTSLRQELASDLAAVAESLATGDDAVARRMDDVRAHSLEAIRDVFELDAARRALRWNPVRRADVEALAGLERRIELAARLYRHARAVARDVLDTHVVDPALAAATRDLAAAGDLALSGRDAQEPLVRAERELAAPFAGDAAIVAAQLRQLAVDLRERL
jgi:uncharacterized membrane protein YgaE (UPF0421/DUF939 family)